MTKQPSSTDIQWKLDYTPKSYRQTTCRRCLIRRLYDGLDAKARTAASERLTIKTTGLYRMLLTKLRKDGWDQIQDMKRFQYVRNCPPVGVRTQNTKAKLCRLDHICPFCWVRNNVLSPFERMEKAFFADVGLRKDLPPVKLVSSLCRSDVADRPHHATQSGAEVFRDKLKILTANVITSRNAETALIPRSQFLGGVVIQSLDLSKGQPVRYRGGLFVVHKDAEVPFETLQLPHHKCRVTELTRTQLMYAMVRVAPYPGGWIRRAEPCQVIDYLKAVHGVRMMSTYVKLRSHLQ